LKWENKVTETNSGRLFVRSFLKLQSHAKEKSKKEEEEIESS